jgi:hypothetical protein
MANVTKRIMTDETGQDIVTQLTTQNEFLTALHGNRANLQTEDKTSLVNAVNELLGKLGTVGDLETLTKANVVAAINELVGKADNKILSALREASGAGIHNALPRCMALGSSFTATQQNAIDNGGFDDLFVGDHWDFTNVPYTWADDEDQAHNDVFSGTFRILDCDYLLRSGDTECTTHHLMVAPDANLFTRAMNPTSTTVGAYAGSEMRTKNSGLARARAIFEACFGAGTLMPHRVYLQNAVTDGKPSAGAWMDSAGAELMTEQQVYGGLALNSGSPDGVSVPNRYTIGCKQFNFFRHRPDMISNRQWYWLQDVVSAVLFALVHHTGFAAHTDASSSGCGVRPVFALRKAA